MSKTSPGRARVTRELLSVEPSKQSFSSAYGWFVRMDYENLPDPGRCYSRKKGLTALRKEINLEDYEEVLSEGMRIIVEKNITYEALPLVYVSNKYGEKMKLLEPHMGLILCMDIYVTDKNLTDPG